MDLRRILLLRTDRIGDVVLTLPMVDMIRGRYPGASVTVLVRKYTRELVEAYPGVDSVITLGEVGPDRDMFAEIRNGGFDAAVHVYPRPEQAWLTWRARIPLRIGTAYRWYSFFFNGRIPDHRKHSGMHEAVLNARLLRALDIEPPDVIRPKLHPAPKHHEAAERLLERKGLRRDEGFVVLHPGSGGSARDWSPAGFSGLARELIGTGVRVVVTGSQGEMDLADRIARDSGNAAISVAGDLTLMELAAFLSRARLFVSNSTGPLHIAAAVGTPVIGFYPPLAAAGVERWGPLGERVDTFVPSKDRCDKCRGTECQGNACMDQITVAAVTARATEILSRTEH